MWPPLESFQHVHVFLVLQSNRRNTQFQVLQVLHEGNLPQPADNIIINTAQHAIGFLHYKNTSLTHSMCHPPQRSFSAKLPSTQCVLLFWSPLKFRPVPHGFLLTNCLNKPKSAKLKSRTLILPFVLLAYLNMVVFAKADIDFHVH